MEFVYVVKRYDLFDLEFPHGFHAVTESNLLSTYLERIKQRGFFIERRFCETDSGFKQVIPYSIVAHDNRILLLKRTTSQGESRLHNKASIGVGGHINPVDDAEDVLFNGCRREIEEELEIEEAYEPVPVGTINDESNAVGSVHFGIVYLIKLESGRVKVRETSMMSAEFVDVDRLKQLADQEDSNIESWSSLIIRSFDALPL